MNEEEVLATLKLGETPAISRVDVLPTQRRTTPSSEVPSELVEQLVKGALAGYIASGPMTVVIHELQDRLPFWERYSLPPGRITRILVEERLLHTRLRRDQHRALMLVTHFGYGALMGALSNAAAWLLNGKELNPLLRGAVYAAVVWTGSYFGVLPALNVLPPAHRHPMRRNVVMIIGHLVWGVSTAILSDWMDGKKK
jgi:hypothetical protein